MEKELLNCLSSGKTSQSRGKRFTFPLKLTCYIFPFHLESCEYYYSITWQLFPKKVSVLFLFSPIDFQIDIRQGDKVIKCNVYNSSIGSTISLCYFPTCVISIPSEMLRILLFHHLTAISKEKYLFFVYFWSNWLFDWYTSVWSNDSIHGNSSLACK